MAKRPRSRVLCMSRTTALKLWSRCMPLQALDAQEDMGYMSTLVRSMSLVLDEFYKTLRSAGVSAATGK